MKLVGTMSSKGENIESFFFFIKKKKKILCSVKPSLSSYGLQILSCSGFFFLFTGSQTRERRSQVVRPLPDVCFIKCSALAILE